MDSFNALSDSDRAALIAAPACITILIAGADRKIDDKEKNWASKVVNYRTFTSDPMLNPYYTMVKERFSEDLNDCLKRWTAETGEAMMKSDLADLNPILKKLDAEFAEHLKTSWRSLAKEVAEASGGFLGIGSVSSEEKRLMELDMIE